MQACSRGSRSRRSFDAVSFLQSIDSALVCRYSHAANVPPQAVSCLPRNNLPVARTLTLSPYLLLMA